MHHGPKRGRLHIKRTGSDRGSWSASQNNANQWIQVDLIGQLTRVTGIATQGRYSQNDIYQWVTSYNLQYSNDGVSFQYYTEQGVKKVHISVEKNMLIPTAKFAMFVGLTILSFSKYQYKISQESYVIDGNVLYYCKYF